MKRSPIQKILFKIEDLFIMVNDCYFRKDNPIVGFRYLRKTLLIIAARFHRKQVKSSSENLKYMIYFRSNLKLRKRKFRLVEVNTI